MPTPPACSLLQYGSFYARALSPAARLIAIIVGIALVFNSLRGVLSGEGMYNAESRQQMLIAGWVGVVAGIGLFCWGMTLFIQLGDA